MKAKVLLFVILFIINCYPQNKDKIELAHKLIQLMGVENTIQVVVGQMIEMQIRNKPGLGKFKNELEKFYDLVFKDTAYLDGICQIYADKFNEEELTLLIEFYESDIGKKLTNILPELSRECMKYGESFALGHKAELDSLLRKRSEEIIKDEVNSVQYKRFFSSDSSCSIELPENWNYNINIIEGAKIQASDPDGVIFVVAIKSDDEETNILTIEDAYKEFEDNLKNNNNEFELVTMPKITKHTSSEIRATFIQKNNNMNLFFNFSLQVKNSEFYIIMCWTNAINQEIVNIFFEHILTSFNILK